jgi:hypothetical protein
MNMFLKKSMQNIPTNQEIINQFKLISAEQPFVILKKTERNPNKKWRGENTLSRIKRRGKIRIGYYKNAMPFSFFNKDSILVGYGIDLAHRLAKDLEVSIEFVPIGIDLLISELDQDYFDIVMSDVFLSSKYAEEMELSKPYLHVSLALLTKRENKNFDSFETTIKLDTFTISYFQRGEIANEFLSYFPNGGSFSITSPKQFFNPKPNDSIKIDAHLTSAERAAAMTVYMPNYKVVNPLPYHLNNALVFPIARDDVRETIYRQLDRFQN